VFNSSELAIGDGGTEEEEVEMDAGLTGGTLLIGVDEEELGVFEGSPSADKYSSNTLLSNNSRWAEAR